MTRLALGLALWSIVHFIPGMMVDLKKNLLNRFGEYPYKGVFTLLMLLAIYLIISGWKAALPEISDLLYTPPEWGGHATAVLSLVGFVLFLAPYPLNNFRRVFRHPQLYGVVCWGVGHLLSNGEPRSILFFGGLTAWAIAEVYLLNRRDGEWVKPARVPFKKDVLLVLFSTLVFLAFLYTHHLLFGGTELI
jgi:uncharacterized membrane protein